jgi:hypothetical protein
MFFCGQSRFFILSSDLGFLALFSGKRHLAREPGTPRHAARIFALLPFAIPLRPSRGSSMSQYELAQLNIGIMKESLDSPLMADFVANLERINALAEESPGFVWRLKTDDGDATALRPLGDETLVNMSVWRDVASLNAYVYRSAHVEIMRRRKEWFGRAAEAHMVLWWVRQGHRPTVIEAIEKLTFLREHGPSAAAFTFRHAFDPPDVTPSAAIEFGDECPAT